MVMSTLVKPAVVCLACGELRKGSSDRHRLFLKPVGTANTPWLSNVPATTCNCSGFIAVYPGCCTAFVATLSIAFGASLSPGVLVDSIHC